QLGERGAYRGIRQPVEDFGLRRPRPGGRVRVGRRQLPVLDLVGDFLARLPLLLAVAVDEGVGENPVEPGAQVRARTELVEVSGRLGAGLLSQVFGLRRIPRHPQGWRVELGSVRPDCLCKVETLRSVGGLCGTVEFNGRQDFPLRTTGDTATW